MASGAMTLCSWYQLQIDDLITKASNTADERLQNFYCNAAEGFRIRLLATPVKVLREWVKK